MADDHDPTSIAQGFARRDAEFAGFPVGPVRDAAPTDDEVLMALMLRSLVLPLWNP